VEGVATPVWLFEEPPDCFEVCRLAAQKIEERAKFSGLAILSDLGESRA
jgi:hypothetical protein